MRVNMHAAVLREAGTISIESRPIPKFGPEDALVRISYVGVCGSDMALFQNGFIGDSVMREPMVLGHEASGTVVAVGERVSALAVGDRVALEPGVPCGHCFFCQRGQYNLCREVYFWASLPVTEGALQEYVRHPADRCFRLPGSVSLLEGALIEPLSVGLYSVLNSGFQLGDSAVVLGAGGVGQLLMLCLEAAGAQNIAVSDIHRVRLETAAAVGGDRVRVVGADEQIVGVDDGFLMGSDFVFECAGSPAAMNRAIEVVRPGGTVVLVGYTHDGRANLNVNLLIDKEITIKTSFRYRHVYERAITGVASGSLPVRTLVSDVFPFEKTQQAMEKAIYDKQATTKCVVAVNPETSEV